MATGCHCVVAAGFSSFTWPRPTTDPGLLHGTQDDGNGSGGNPQRETRPGPMNPHKKSRFGWVDIQAAGLAGVPPGVPNAHGELGIAEVTDHAMST